MHLKDSLKILNREIAACELVGVTNDIFEAEDRHYVTLFYVARSFSGTPEVREPDKCDAWQWWPWQALPENLFLPLRHFREQQLNSKELPLSFSPSA